MPTRLTEALRQVLPKIDEPYEDASLSNSERVAMDAALGDGFGARGARDAVETSLPPHIQTGLQDSYRIRFQYEGYTQKGLGLSTAGRDGGQMRAAQFKHLHPLWISEAKKIRDRKPELTNTAVAGLMAGPRRLGVTHLWPFNDQDVPCLPEP